MKVRIYAFDWLYVKRFCSLQKIFFPAFATYSSGLMAFLLVVSALEQYVAFKVSKIVKLRHLEQLEKVTLFDRLPILQISKHCKFTEKKIVYFVSQVIRQILCCKHIIVGLQINV